MANNHQIRTETVGKARIQQLRSLFEESGKGKTPAVKNLDNIKVLNNKQSPETDVKSASNQPTCASKDIERIQNPYTQRFTSVRKEKYIRLKTSVEPVSTQNSTSKVTEHKLSKERSNIRLKTSVESVSPLNPASKVTEYKLSQESSLIRPMTSIESVSTQNLTSMATESLLLQERSDIHSKTSVESSFTLNPTTKSTETEISQERTLDNYQSGLRQHYELIVNRTVLDRTVFDHLVSSCILIVEDRETVMKKDTQQHRNRTLMNILLDRPYGVDRSFTEALAVDSCNTWLVDRLTSSISPEEQQLHTSDYILPISDHTVKLQKNYHHIVHDTDCKGLVADQLFAEDVLSPEDFDEVYTPGLTTAESNRRVVAKIIYKDRTTYDIFIASLRQDECYKDLADNIEDTDVTDHDKELIQIAKSKLKDQLEEKTLKVEHFEIKRWRNKLKHFVKTSTTKQIQNDFRDHQLVILTGSSGSGKTANAFFVALEMEEYEGYVIHLADDPTDIKFTSNENQIFIFDDACGKVCVDPHAVNLWRKYENGINDLLKSHKCVKLVIISRSIVDVKSVFNGITACVVKECVISTSLQERRKICESYLSTEIVNSIPEETMKLYSFFPLLCTMYFENERGNADVFFRSPYDVVQDELTQIMENDKAVFLCLALLVVLNNKVPKGSLRFGNNSLDDILKCLCEEGPVDIFPSTKLVLSGFRKLTGTYIAESETVFTALHDRMFDIMAKYLGIKFINTILLHGDSSLISERLVFKSLQYNLPKFATQIPRDLEIEYFDRMKQDISIKRYWEVFGNLQTQYKEYRASFIEYMEKEDVSFDNNQDDEFSPLLVVSFLGHLDFVEYIISKNPTLVNKCDDFGRSPLYIAVRNDFPEIVQLLIANDADVNIRSSRGWSPLHKACQKERPELAMLLITHGANVDEVGERKRSAMHLACENGNFELVKYLYGCHANIKQVDKDGWAPLHISCQQGNVKIVSFLLEVGSDINLAEKRKWTPLHIASGNGNTEVCKALLDCGVYIDDVEENGGTALYMACQNGYKEVVSLLIEHGASVNTSDVILLSPIRVAKLNKHTTVYHLLANNGAFDENSKQKIVAGKLMNRSPLTTTSALASYHFDKVVKKRIELL